MDQQGVEVRVGDHHDVAVRRLQGRCGRSFSGVHRQPGAEVDEVGQDDGAALVAVGQDLPATLVAGEVVQLVVAVLSSADDDGEALGLGECLVDVCAIRADKQLAHQLRVGESGAVGHLTVYVLQGTAAVDGHLGYCVEGHLAGVCGVGRGYCVYSGRDRSQYSVS